MSTLTGKMSSKQPKYWTEVSISTHMSEVRTAVVITVHITVYVVLVEDMPGVKFRRLNSLSVEDIWCRIKEEIES